MDKRSCWCDELSADMWVSGLTRFCLLASDRMTVSDSKQYFLRSTSVTSLYKQLSSPFTCISSSFFHLWLKSLKNVFSCFGSQYSLTRTSAGCRSRGHVQGHPVDHSLYSTHPESRHQHSYMHSCSRQRSRVTWKGKKKSPVFFAPFVLHLVLPHRVVFPLIQRGFNGNSIARPEKGVNFFFSAGLRVKRGAYHISCVRV